MVKRMAAAISNPMRLIVRESIRVMGVSLFG
jgi:hypothetical protein